MQELNTPTVQLKLHLAAPEATTLLAQSKQEESRAAATQQSTNNSDSNNNNNNTVAFEVSAEKFRVLLHGMLLLCQ